MSDYRSPTPMDPSPEERRFRRTWRILGLVLLGVCILSLAGFLTWAFRPPTAQERAKNWVSPPRPTESRRSATPRHETRSRPTAPVPATPPGPQPPPPVEHAPAEVPMSAQGVSAKEAAEDKPEAPILQSINGQETITIRHQWLAGQEMTVPVSELRLVSPNAKQTAIGVCAGKRAARQGNLRTRNRVFLRTWRVACAAFTGFCVRPCGRPGLSFVAHTQYQQLLKRGGKLVASKASTRYAPFYPYFKKGDYLFFWKSGRRIGHCEVCVGGGWTVGTSSSAGYVARRRVGNRGFRTMSVVRL